ncbi:unnamed protein product [Dicrocoelium dendriticum]|nr:unnamed protein product [Dicrocoelium dendriticum]
MLVNLLSPSIYQHIVECKAFESTVSLLRSPHMCPKNTVSARYLLTTCKQECVQKISQFVGGIQLLAKDYSFCARSLSADGAMRDALIAALQSNYIRMRLLKQPVLSFHTIYEIATSLEFALKQSHIYGTEIILCTSKTFVPVTQARPNRLYQSYAEEIAISADIIQTPLKCPAKNGICKTCGKRGISNTCANPNPPFCPLLQYHIHVFLL